MANPLQFVLQGQDETGTAFRGILGNLKRTAQGTRKLLGVFRDITVVGTGVVRSLKGIGRSLASTLTAAERQVGAETRLAAALAQSGEGWRENFERIKEFASARQDVTTFGDEMSLELAAIGASFGLTGDQIIAAVEAVQDRSLALGRGPAELMRVIGRFGGSVSDSLIDVGFVADKTAPRVEEFTRAMAEMTTGMAEAVGALPTSAFTKFQNTLGDLQESFGKVVASTGTFQAALRLVEGLIDRINNAIDDPAQLEKIVATLDGVAKGIVSFFVTISSTVLDTVGDAVDGLGAIVNALQMLGIIASKSTVDKELGKIAAQMAFAKMMGDSFRGSLEALEIEEGLLRDQQQALTQINQITGESFHNAADDVRVYGAALNFAIDAGRMLHEAQEDVFAGLDKIAKKADEVGAGIVIPVTLETLTADELADLESFQIFTELLSSAGEGSAAAFSTSFSEVLSNDSDMGEAMSDLGKRLRVSLSDQMSEQAFAPIKASFGVLATTLAQPFQVVGNLINSVLAPISGMISKVIGTLITEMLSVIGLQTLATTTGMAGIATIAVGAQALGTAWGAAATAAAIATLGAATAAAPAAIAAISLGAATTAALSVPALAAGGVVQPTPGGTLARIGEAGKAEAVIPLTGGAVPVDLIVPPTQPLTQAPSVSESVTQVFNFDGANFTVDGDAEEFADTVGEEMLLRVGSLRPGRAMGALI